MLTDEELHVVDLICIAHNAYAALPRQHPSDMLDFVNATHVQQGLVMQRCARECHPHAFPNKMDR